MNRTSMRSFTQLLAVALLALASGCTSVPAPAPVQEREVPSSFDARSVRSPLVEPPGALFADVTQASISTTICKPGWTATVRPSTAFTQGVKLKFLREVGLDPDRAADYELDHFVPLALGGHPRSLDNLWLQRWDGEWNARVKDRLERRLQVTVCEGRLTLRAAQTAVERNWKRAYRRYVVETRGASSKLVEGEVVE